MITFEVKNIIKIVLATFFVANTIFAHAQTISFGLRATPSQVPGVKVVNPSPSNVYGPTDLNLNVGVFAQRYFKGERTGIRLSVDAGALPSFTGIQAPRNAFGQMDDTGVMVDYWIRTTAHNYKAVSLTAVYKVPVKTRFVEFSLGPSVRHYTGYYKAPGSQEYIFAFNRSVPYNPDDPNAGPADLRAKINDLHRLYLSFPVSADYLVRTGKRSQMKFGIMHNISKPLNGELDVQMFGKIYSGSYRPRTGFWGLNVQYERLPKKSAAEFKKRAIGSIDTTRHRKAIYLETYKRIGFLTANYDLRLSRGQNNGFGLSVGAGLGEAYRTAYSTDNKTNRRKTLAMPIGVNYIVGNRKHGAEIGAGFTGQFPLEKVMQRYEYNGHFYHFRAGYRFQPLLEGFIARAAWIPTANKSLISPDYQLELGNVGVSLGYSFK